MQYHTKHTKCHFMTFFWQNNKDNHLVCVWRQNWSRARQQTKPYPLCSSRTSSSVLWNNATLPANWQQTSWPIKMLVEVEKNILTKLCPIVLLPHKRSKNEKLSQIIWFVNLFYLLSQHGTTCQVNFSAMITYVHAFVCSIMANFWRLLYSPQIWSTFYSSYNLPI